MKERQRDKITKDRKGKRGNDDDKKREMQKDRKTGRQNDKMQKEK